MMVGEAHRLNLPRDAGYSGDVGNLIEVLIQIVAGCEHDCFRVDLVQRDGVWLCVGT
jgi:hypothetical protein